MAKYNSSLVSFPHKGRRFNDKVHFQTLDTTYSLDIPAKRLRGAAQVPSQILWDMGVWTGGRWVLTCCGGVVLHTTYLSPWMVVKLWGKHILANRRPFCQKRCAFCDINGHDFQD